MISKAKLKITFEGVEARFYVFPHTRPEQEKHAARSVSPGSRHCCVTRSPGPRTPGWDDIFIAGKMNIHNLSDPEAAAERAICA